MKWFGLFIVAILVFVGSLPFLMLDSHRMVGPSGAITADEAKVAQGITKQFHRSLAGQENNLQLAVSNDELSALLKVASYSLPFVDVESRITSFGVTFVASVQLKYKGIERYVNMICIVSNGYQSAEIESCKVGSLPIPGFILMPAIEFSLKQFVGQHSLTLWRHFLRNLSFERNLLTVKNIDVNKIKPALQASLTEANGLVSGSTAVDKTLVVQYINFLSLQTFTSKSLLEPVNSVFTRVAEQTLNSAADTRYEHVNAAVWALVVRFGNPQFGKLIGLPGKIAKGSALSLKSRNDLALHFLYSAFLQLSSGAQTAFNIGELKELIDSNEGGSGFSFADIVADKAGLTFAEFLTNPDNDLQMASLRLAKAESESIFMLDINERPEGISEREFVRRYQSIQSAEYKKVISEIGEQVKQLPLYR